MDGRFIKLPKKSVARSLCVLVFAGVTSLSYAQDHGSISGNPYPTPEDAAAGAKSFRTLCASCHGADAAGGSVAPSLVIGSFRNGGSDETLFRTVTKGIPGTAMQGFNIAGRDAWQIITYLRSLNILKAAAKATGDAIKGSKLFETNRCGTCHTVGIKGGLTGPDLSEIGLRRSLVELETSVIDPDAEVFADYWSVRAHTRTGEVLSGIRMNEDMDTIQFRDESGRLRSLRKSEMAGIELIRKSPMPSFRTKLSGQELQDLVAYLAGLRGDAESTRANQ